MDRKPRKIERLLTDKSVEEILYSTDYGVICVTTEEGYAYGTPVNYVYDGKYIYFHGANTGLRYESVMKNNKASLTVVSKHIVLPEVQSTAYRSVIAFGTLSICEGKEIGYGLQTLLNKYPCANGKPTGLDYCKSYDRVAVFKFEIESVTGKHRPLDIKNLEKEA